jgi:hypothetical protein
MNASQHFSVSLIHREASVSGALSRAIAASNSKRRSAWRQVEDGWAWCYPRYLKRPEECLPRERVAREAKKGLWSEPNPQAPWEFRAAKHRKAPIGERSLSGQKQFFALRSDRGGGGRGSHLDKVRSNRCLVPFESNPRDLGNLYPPVLDRVRNAQQRVEPVLPFEPVRTVRDAHHVRGDFRIEVR